jgi:hypothetical protein
MRCELPGSGASPPCERYERSAPVTGLHATCSGGSNCRCQGHRDDLRPVRVAWPNTMEVQLPIQSRSSIPRQIVYLTLALIVLMLLLVFLAR